MFTVNYPAIEYRWKCFPRKLKRNGKPYSYQVTAGEQLMLICVLSLKNNHLFFLFFLEQKRGSPWGNFPPILCLRDDYSTDSDGWVYCSTEENGRPHPSVYSKPVGFPPSFIFIRLPPTIRNFVMWSATYLKSWNVDDLIPFSYQEEKSLSNSFATFSKRICLPPFYCV
jgi:hypothetical protein